MSLPSSSSSGAAGIEIFNTRVFDAPCPTVFNAFADPAQLARWWGPNGFTNTIKTFDLHPGGTWRLIMHGPNGADFENVSRFVEVVAPKKIVYDHLQPMHHFRMTMTYDEVAGGQTRLTWRMHFEKTAENEKLKDVLAAANEQNFDRLAAWLQTLQP
ncbi:MAG TPA: SRPBCC family protein [Opitutaceae bacterium]